MRAELSEQNLMNQLCRTLHITEEYAQRFFDENHVAINLRTHDGLENVIRIGGPKINRADEHDADYLFEDHDMRDLGRTALEVSISSYYVMQMVDGIRGRNPKNPDNPMKVFVFREGERFPRQLTFDAERKELKLSEPADVSLPRPEYPGVGKAILHFFFGRLFGAYNTVFENYDRDMRIYNQRMNYLRDPDVHRRERAQAREEQQRQEETNLKNTLLPRLSRELGKQLDGIFSAAEKQTMHESGEPDIDRLDCVMIGSRSARACILEECCLKTRKQDGSYDIEDAGKKLYQQMTRSEKLERMNRFILEAQTNGKTVSYLLPDASGRLTPNEKGGKFHMLEDTHESYKTGEYEWQMLGRILNAELLQPEQAQTDAERLRQKDAAAKAMEQKLLFQRGRVSVPGSASMTDSLFKAAAAEKKTTARALLGGLDSPRSLSVSRSALQSHALAALLVSKDGLTPEELFDPAKGAEKKAEMGKEVLKRYQNGDYAWFADVNLRASEKLSALISDTVKKSGGGSALFSEENFPALASVTMLFDLQQERAHLIPECLSCLAKEAGTDPINPEAFRPQLDALSSKTDDLIRTMNALSDAARESADLALGVSTDPSRSVGIIVTGELYRSDAMKTVDGRPAFEPLPEEKQTVIGAAMAAEQMKLLEGTGVLSQITKTSDFGKLKEFGTHVMNGVFHNVMRLSVKDTENGPELSAEKRAEPAKAAAKETQPNAEKTIDAPVMK